MPGRAQRLKAGRQGGEIAHWVELLSSVFAAEPGTVLRGGPAARLVVRLCSAEAVTLGRVVLYSATAWRELERRSDAALLLLAHELVHVGQYRRLGVIRFLLSYGREYLRGRLAGLSHARAYLEISFEKEARQGELVARRLLDAGALLRG